jgi:hemoglobin
LSLFDDLGGEPVLRSIIGTFVDRMFADPMIGFHFRKANRRRIAEKEYELAAEHLGAGVQYSGRAIREVHAVHAILGGQFDRRLEILRRTLEEAGAPPAVVAHWLAYTENLRSHVTPDTGGQCIGDEPGAGGSPGAPRPPKAPR